MCMKSEGALQWTLRRFKQKTSSSYWDTVKTWPKVGKKNSPSIPPTKLQPSTGKLGFNSRLIVQMETKTKSGRDNTWTGFCIFREPDSSSIQLHTENLFRVKISISSYLSDTCCEKWKKKNVNRVGEFSGARLVWGGDESYNHSFNHLIRKI